MPNEYRKLSDWLELKYAEWQPTQERKQRSIRAFADYLGIREPLLNMLFNGRRIRVSQETADKIAAKLGDDIYDLVGQPRPDPDLKYIEMNWVDIPLDARKSIRTVAETALKRYESRSSAPASGMAAPDET